MPTLKTFLPRLCAKVSSNVSFTVPPGSCAALVPPVTINGVAYGVCQDDCNLATPADICGPNATCLPIVDGTNPPHTACAGVPDACTTTTPNCTPIKTCAPSSSFPLAGPCADDTACPPGATCKQGSCVAWCVMGPMGHCPGGTVCTAESPALVIAGVTYGTCQ